MTERQLRTGALIRLFEDSRSAGTCRGCGAALDWYETLTGKRMCMDAGSVPRKSENDPSSRRVIAFFSSTDTHWNTCPKQQDFRRA